MQNYRFKSGPYNVYGENEDDARRRVVFAPSDLYRSEINNVNSERSWLETFSEIHSLCWGRMAGDGTVIGQVQENEGRFGVLDQIIDWTNEFEQKYKDEDWIELDWIDTVEAFINEKNQEQ